MTAEVFYESDREAVIYMSDGGVATFHHNEEHMLTTYYQDRIEIQSDDIWLSLAESKVYLKDWADKQSIDEEMIADAVRWLSPMSPVTEIKVIKTI